MPSVPVPASPVPRALVFAAALVLVGAVCVLHHEVLVGGQVYHMDDAADGYYPSHVAAARALREGTLATWERGAWCGWPLANDPYYGVFYPGSAAFLIFGAVRGVAVSIVAHTLLAALAMAWLLRRRKLDVGAVLFGAASFALSSFLVVRIRHLIFAEGMAWLPLILVGVEGYLQTRRRRELALAAAATGGALLCGALPLLPYLMMGVLAYALPRLLREERRVAAAAALGAAGLVGAMLGCAQLLPTVAHLPWSPRSLATDYQFASTYAWPDARYLGTLIAPDIFGGEERGNWFGVFNHWEMAGFYCGALAAAFFPFGLLRARKKPELVGLALASALAVALAFGDHLPVHGWFFRHVPLYAALRCPTRALVLFVLAAPILGAEGLTWIVERDPAVKRRAVGVALALGYLAAAAAAFWKLTHHGAMPAGESASRAAFAHLAAVVGVALAFLSLRMSGIFSARAVSLLLALVAVGDLLIVDRGYVQPKPADWAPGTERFAAVDWLLSQHPDDRFLPDAHGPFRLHNLGMTYGIESAGGYDSVTVWRMVNFIYTINHGAPYPWTKLKDDLAAGAVTRLDSPLVDLMNVRWAIAPRAPAGWVERFRPKPGDAPHARHEASWDAQLAVFENPHALPRAFVVYTADVQPDDAAQARALPKLDPRTTVLLDQTPEPRPIGDRRTFSPAKLVSAKRHEVRLEADASAPGILVLSETYYPGWTATLDGNPVPILRADYAFRGVALPAGHHVVEMRFASRPTRVGLAISGLGLLALFALGWPTRRKRDMIR